MGEATTVIDMDQTWLQLVQGIARDEFALSVDQRQADHILWEHTAFPVCGLEHTVAQVREFFATCGAPASNSVPSNTVGNGPSGAKATKETVPDSQLKEDNGG